MLDSVVLGALITAVPMSATAIVAWRTHGQVRTNHGRRAGEYIELISSDLIELRNDFKAHTEVDKRNFRVIAQHVGVPAQELHDYE